MAVAVQPLTSFPGWGVGGGGTEATPAPSPGGCDMAPAAAAGARGGKPRGVPGSRHLPTCFH